MPGRKVVKVYLDPTLASRLENYSEKWGLGESEIMRAALVQYLHDLERASKDPHTAHTTQ